MDRNFRYPAEVREWLDDFGEDKSNPLSLGSRAQMDKFIEGCEVAVDYYYYHSHKRRAPKTRANIKLAVRQCKSLICTLEKESREKIEPFYEDDTLRMLRDLLFDFEYGLAFSSKNPGRPEKTDELLSLIHI